MQTGRLLAGTAVDDANEPALDQATFAAYYERHRDAIFRYHRARCSSDEEAADATATTFERAWRARNHFRGPQAAFAAWIFRVARHLAIDAARRQATRKRALILWSPAAAAPDPADLVLRDEADRLLVRRLADLPELQREAVLLRYAGGLTTVEIAKVIGKGEEATQKLLSRTIGRLKEAFRDDV